MRCHRHNNAGPLTRGVTLLELIVVISVGAIITAVTIGAFSGIAPRKTLEKETSGVLSLLEQARNLTLSAKNASVYGVHFEATKAVLFTGSIYSASATSNVVGLLSPLVQISPITLAGGGSEVVFNRLVGDTTQSGTVKIYLVASSTQSKTITIFATGLLQAN